MQLDLGLNAPISVGELTLKIKSTLESDYRDVWVVGQITDLRTPASGHLYFQLKDADAQIKVVFFRSGSRFLKFRPEDGVEVILRGRLTVYEPKGEYQIVAEYMEPKGIGALQLAFLQMKEKLDREGLFAPSVKKPLPPYPRRVGVVTSPSGAAVRDILNVLGRRAPGVSILLSPCLVQGESSPDDIAAALSMADAAGLDVIIVGRGGGSMEDLAAFNTERVARAIFGCRTPVISAVGHETDFTIADFVADLRAATPSAAAELVAKSEEGVRDRVSTLGNRLRYCLSQELRFRRTRLDSLTRGLPDMERRVQDGILRLDDLSVRLAGSTTRSLKLARERLASISRLLASAQPLSPLGKGFALAMRLPGLEVISTSADVSEGELLRLQLKTGVLDCRVEKKY